MIWLHISGIEGSFFPLLLCRYCSLYQLVARKSGKMKGINKIFQGMTFADSHCINFTGKNQRRNDSSPGSSTDDAKSNALHNTHSSSNGNDHSSSKTDEEKSTRKLMDCSSMLILTAGYCLKLALIYMVQLLLI